jgi:hypothetical protein
VGLLVVVLLLHHLLPLLLVLLVQQSLWALPVERCGGGNRNWPTHEQGAVQGAGSGHRPGLCELHVAPGVGAAGVGLGTTPDVFHLQVYRGGGGGGCQVQVMPG